MFDNVDGVVLGIEKTVCELCSTGVESAFAKSEAELERPLSSPGICCSASIWELLNLPLLASIEGLKAMKALGDHLAHWGLTTSIRQSCLSDAKKSLTFLKPEFIMAARNGRVMLFSVSLRSRVGSMGLDPQRWSTGHDWGCT